jgi:hypothetical protein
MIKKIFTVSISFIITSIIATIIIFWGRVLIGNILFKMHVIKLYQVRTLSELELIDYLGMSLLFLTASLIYFLLKKFVFRNKDTFFNTSLLFLITYFGLILSILLITTVGFGSNTTLVGIFEAALFVFTCFSYPKIFSYIHNLIFK